MVKTKVIPTVAHVVYANATTNVSTHAILSWRCYI
jgi:hypothetical protein